MSPEDLELLLLNFSSIDDSKVTTSASRYLPRLLAQLGLKEPPAGVDPLLKAIQFILRRVEALQAPLPFLIVSGLFSSFESPVSRATALLIISKGFEHDRKHADIPEALRTLFDSWKSLSENEKTSILHLSFSGLHFWIEGKGVEFLVDIVVKRDLLDFFVDVLTFPLIKIEDETKVEGHSQESIQRVTKFGQKKWSVPEMSHVRLQIIQFLASGSLSSVDVYPLVLIACSDHEDKVSNAAQDVFRRQGKIVLDEEPELVPKLFDLYLGREKRNPVGLGLKNILLKEFCKSIKAASFGLLSIKVLTDALLMSPAKVQISGLQFLQWVLAHGDPNLNTKIAPVLIAKLLVLLKSLSLSSLSMSETSLKAYLYEPIASLCCASPSSVNKGIQTARLYFESLTSDSANGLSIQGALNVLVQAYKGSNDSVLLELRNFLCNEILESDEPRYFRSHASALKWLHDLYSFDDISCRIIFCFNCAHPDKEVVAAAHRGLTPRLQDGLLSPYPHFGAFCRELWREFAPDRITSRGLLVGPSALKAGITFARKCLGYTKISGTIDTISSEDLDKFSDCLLLSIDSATFKEISIVELLSAAWDIICNTCVFLKEASSILHRRFLLHFKSNLIEKFCFHAKKGIRRHACQVLSHAFVYLTPPSDGIALLKKSLENLSRESLELSVLEGSSLILGSCIPMIRSSLCGDEDFAMLMTRSASKLTQYVNHPSPSLSSACAESIGLICQEGLPFPLPFTYSESHGEPKLFTLMQLITRLRRLCSSKEEGVDVNLAIDSMGSLALSIVNHREPQHHIQDCMDMLVESLFQLSNLKETSSFLNVGFAIAKICSILPELSCHQTGIPWLQYVCDHVAQDLILKGSKIVKTFAAAILLCVCKELFGNSLLSNHLRLIQNQFLLLLEENSNITQELAAKGLVVVFEAAPTSLQEELLKQVIKIFSESSFKIQASDSKEASPESDLGFQTIAAISRDLGQPALVYRFLEINCNNVIWNANKAQTFNSGILKYFSETDLAAKFAAKIPKVYLYLFDQVRAILMKEIWSALGEDKALESHFADIMIEVLKACSSREWRVRHACCFCLSSLLDKRDFKQISDFIPELLRVSFYLLDDVNDLVQKCSLSLKSKIMSLITRFCDPKVSHDAQACIDAMLPHFLDHGLAKSSAKAVQEFSIAAILTISKGGTSSLRPYLARLVEVLIDSMSQIEPMELSYAMHHTQALNVTVEDMENLRLMLINASPLSVALENCLGLVNEAVLPEVSAKVLELVRSSVGLGSMYGSVKCLKFLINSFPEFMSKYSNKTIPTLKPMIFDASPLVRKSFSSALAQVCKISDPSFVASNLVLSLFESYYNDYEMDHRLKIASFMKELSRQASNSISACRDRVITFSFIHSFEEFDQKDNEWKFVFEESIPGGKSATFDQLIHEFVQEISASLKCDVYSSKRASALAIQNLCQTLGKHPVLRGKFLVIMDELLLVIVHGSSFKGKSDLFQAIVALCRIADRSCISQDYAGNVLKSIVIAMARDGLVSEGVSAMSSVSSFFKSGSIALSLTKEFFVQMTLGSSSEDEESDGGSRLNQKRTQVSLLNSLAKMWESCDTESQMDSGGWTADVVESMVVGKSYEVRSAALSAMQTFCRTLALDSALCHAFMHEKFISSLQLSLKDSKHETVRTAALNVFLGVFSREDKGNIFFSVDEKKKLLEQFRACLSDTSPSVLLVARNLVELVARQVTEDSI